MFISSSNSFTWNQVWQDSAGRAARTGAVPCWLLADEQNKDDASGDDDRCFCDYLNCSMCEKPCDTNCKRHYSMVANVVVPCDVSRSTLCSVTCHKHHIDDMLSMVEAMTNDLTKFLQHRHLIQCDFLRPIVIFNWIFAKQFFFFLIK